MTTNSTFSLGDVAEWCDVCGLNSSVVAGVRDHLTEVEQLFKNLGPEGRTVWLGQQQLAIQQSRALKEGAEKFRSAIAKGKTLPFGKIVAKAKVLLSSASFQHLVLNSIIRS